MRYKYPRTFHMPWSLGRSNDDRVHDNLDFFNGQEVVVTVKMDGENFTGYQDYCHARSLDSRHHPSRNWVKSFWATRSYKMPEGWRLCGENLYAKHSIEYTSLASYLMAFSVWNEKNICLSWEDTEKFCQEIEVLTVPVLYKGPWAAGYIEELFWKATESGQEGIVVRNAGEFSYDDFSQNMAKAVRANHVNHEDSHWMFKSVTPNKLA